MSPRATNILSWLGAWVTGLLAMVGVAAVLGLYARLVRDAFLIGWRLL